MNKNMFRYLVVFLSASMIILYLFFAVYGKPYLVTCSSFLEVWEIDTWKNDNQEMLENISWFSEHLDFDTFSCPWKVWLIIYYSWSSERKEIIKQVWSMFFIEWIPYKMKNI